MGPHYTIMLRCDIWRFVSPIMHFWYICCLGILIGKLFYVPGFHDSMLCMPCFWVWTPLRWGCPLILWMISPFLIPLWFKLTPIKLSFYHIHIKPWCSDYSYRNFGETASHIHLHITWWVSWVNYGCIKWMHLVWGFRGGGIVLVFNYCW